MTELVEWVIATAPADQHCGGCDVEIPQGYFMAKPAPMKEDLWACLTCVMSMVRSRQARIAREMAVS